MTQEAVDYRPMWQSLGLDLDAHDQLLAAIPQLYQQAYLTQQNRPEGMAYFDFVMSEIHGLRIKELVDHRAAGGTVRGATLEQALALFPSWGDEWEPCPPSVTTGTN